MPRPVSMRRHLAGLVACVALLTGCQAQVPAAIAPTVEATLELATPTPAAVPAPSEPATTVPATSVPPTIARTPRPTLVPTPRPTIAPTATTTEPRPTLTATHVAQQHFCDIASPPAHLLLPPPGPYVHITPADVVTQPISSAGGPQKQSTDAPPRVTAPHVAILDEASGNLLYAQDAFSRQPPASITKIVTTIVALERGPDLHTVFTTSVSA